MAWVLIGRELMVERKALAKEKVSEILLSGYDDLDRICHPLFKSTPIKYFDYIRYYDNGDAVGFSMSPEFSVKTLCESLLPTYAEFQLFSLFGQKACFLSTSSSLPPGVGDVNQEKFEKNIAYGIDHKVYHRLYLVTRRDNYYLTTGFGVVFDNKSILNFYLNALPYLQRFLQYFEYHAEETIEYQYKKNILFLPNYHDKLIYQDEEINFPVLNPNDLDFNLDFVKQSPRALTTMTSREKACLELVAQGYTMKNAAKRLAISHRTVEQHLRNIKDKLGLTTKNQLVEIWHEYSTRSAQES